MEPHHKTSFPTTLCKWVGEIVQSSPEAARLTLLELIVGALLASGGHVTQAILALTPRLGWQAYHWMIERAGSGCPASLWRCAGSSRWWRCWSSPPIVEITEYYHLCIAAKHAAFLRVR